ncbi:helix-turn-helix domain-containing protein [Streptomyces sannanensis]|uniref:Helix-turn-helix domain-containing protein n=1 Tax=Streptomyces sannanensis TaxID=285536 RepID=A0ABP6SDD5_9ACTN
MAEPQSNARLRADAGAPTSGVIHVRTRLTADFTVISNALAQRRGSAVTVGVAVYILSLPSGTPVTIAALCEHFTEGEILISRALRELEEAGYLERRRERLPTGQIRTRTYFYDVPGGDPDPDGPPEPPKPRRPRKQPAVAAATPATVQETVHTPTQSEAETPIPLADADPQAVAVLAALRRVDPRLILSGQEAARLAPAVAQWLAAGVGAPQITELLTARLPDRFRARPAGILAFRLRETPLPVPPPPAHPVDRAAVLPFQTCDGCDRAFRAPEPGRCRDCRAGNHLRAAG